MLKRDIHHFAAAAGYLVSPASRVLSWGLTAGSTILSLKIQRREE